MPTMVAPGGEVVVTITTTGFTAGGMKRPCPRGSCMKRVRHSR